MRFGNWSNLCTLVYRVSSTHRYAGLLQDTITIISQLVCRSFHSLPTPSCLLISLHSVPNLPVSPVPPSILLGSNVHGASTTSAIYFHFTSFSVLNLCPPVPPSILQCARLPHYFISFHFTSFSLVNPSLPQFFSPISFQCARRRRPYRLPVWTSTTQSPRELANN